MNRIWNARSWLLVGIGLGLGLLVGVGMSAGTVIGMRAAGAGSTPAVPADLSAAYQEMRLRAVATSGAETMAMATGTVDEQSEGLFFLDFLTGELQCFVLNPRIGKFTGWFKTNVIKELPIEKGKKPSYVMVTGGWNPLRGGTIARPAGCVVYVADANTGGFAAYTFPWIQGTSSTLAQQAATFITLDGGRARTLDLRE
jgi:hypothetical protein